MEAIRDAYVGALMSYIEMEYDNIPPEVTEEMARYFEDCFNEGESVCLPNAAGGFWERFLKTSETA